MCLHAVARCDLFPQRQQHLVDEHGAVVRVVDDVGELVGVEAEVERVEHAAHQRDAEVGFEVRTVVPAERRDAVAGLDAESMQRAGEAPRADREVGVGVAMDRLVGSARHDSRGEGRSARRGGRSPTA